jgi:hypothetical protein
MENKHDMRGSGTSSTQKQNEKKGGNNYYDNNDRSSHQEGPVAKQIEKETSKLPSDLFLWTGLGLLATAVVLQSVTKKSHWGLLVGQFAAPILIMGLYNKTVKQSGHDYIEDDPQL